MRTRELAEWLGATFEGDGEKELTGVAAVETAGAADLSFVARMIELAQYPARFQTFCPFALAQYPFPQFACIAPAILILAANDISHLLERA